MIPQIIVLFLAFSGMLISAYQHDKPKDGKHNFWVSFIAQLITIALLWWGGFFDKML